jgi:hypothetical protein
VINGEEVVEVDVCGTARRRWGEEDDDVEESGRKWWWCTLLPLLRSPNRFVCRWRMQRNSSSTLWQRQ